MHSTFAASPPAWWCGLKCAQLSFAFSIDASPPAWWCGLKYHLPGHYPILLPVTTCVVVWIEILVNILELAFLSVTTCVVVWIEMTCMPARRLHPARWWGVNCVLIVISLDVSRHHLRSGVD